MQKDKSKKDSDNQMSKTIRTNEHLDTKKNIPADIYSTYYKDLNFLVVLYFYYTCTTSNTGLKWVMGLPSNQKVPN